MEWIWNALLALVAGSVGSLLFVPASSRLGEAAKTRYATATRLLDVLRTYRQELEYQYDRCVSENHGYPPEFAALAGQERLTADVLLALPDLGKRTREKLRQDLETLVGPTMLGFAESRMYVADGIHNQETEQARLDLALHRVNREPDRYSEGILQRLLSDQNEHPAHSEHYQAALALLDRMAGLVKP